MAIDPANIKLHRCKNINAALGTVGRYNEDDCDTLHRTTFRCKGLDGVYRFVTKRIFFLQCPRISLNCSSVGGAFVSAVTICNQQLYY